MLNGNAAAHIKHCNRKHLFDGKTIKMLVFVALDAHDAIFNSFLLHKGYGRHS